MERGHALNVSLTKHLATFVRKKVKSGRYGSASEVVREALRLMEDRDEGQQRKLEELRRAIQIGIDQADRGQVTDGEAFFEDLLGRKKRRRAG
jgi:antitoxin ParD1/3/4